MTRVPMAARRTACVGAWLVGAAAGCAGSAPKTTTPAMARVAPSPVASPTASGSTAGPSAASAAPVPAPSGAAPGASAVRRSRRTGVVRRGASAVRRGHGTSAVRHSRGTSAVRRGGTSAARRGRSGGARLGSRHAGARGLDGDERVARAVADPRCACARASARAAASARRRAALQRGPRAGSRYEGRAPPRPGRRPRGRRSRARPARGHTTPRPDIVVDVVARRGRRDPRRTCSGRRATWATGPSGNATRTGSGAIRTSRGKVSLELAVSPSGAVNRSVVNSATVGDEIVSACVAREALHLALPASGVADDGQGRRVPRRRRRTRPGRAAGAQCGALRSALRGSWGAVRRCYASEPRESPWHRRPAWSCASAFDTARSSRPAKSAAPAKTGASATRTSRGACSGSTGRPKSWRRRTRAHERSFVYALHFESVPVDAARRS